MINSYRVCNRSRTGRERARPSEQVVPTGSGPVFEEPRLVGRRAHTGCARLEAEIAAERVLGMAEVPTCHGEAGVEPSLGQPEAHSSQSQSPRHPEHECPRGEWAGLIGGRVPAALPGAQWALDPCPGFVVSGTHGRSSAVSPSLGCPMGPKPQGPLKGQERLWLPSALLGLV